MFNYISPPLSYTPNLIRLFYEHKMNCVFLVGLNRNSKNTNYNTAGDNRFPLVFHKEI